MQLRCAEIKIGSAEKGHSECPFSDLAMVFDHTERRAWKISTAPEQCIKYTCFPGYISRNFPS